MKVSLPSWATSKSWGYVVSCACTYYFLYITTPWFNALIDEIELAGLTGLNALWPFTMPALALVLSILVHEIGHWAAGHFMGYRCLIFSVLWLRLERHDSSWRVRLVRTRKNAWGFVSSLPLHFHRFRLRHGIHIAAGPAISLLTGGLALQINNWLKPAYLLSAGASLPVYMLGLLLACFGGISVFFGVLNLLPLTANTDGTKILQVLTGGPAAERSYALLRIYGATCDGLRPRVWESQWLEQLLGLSTKTEADCLAHAYCYAHYFDLQNLEKVRFHLNAALDLRQAASAPLQQYLFCQAAYVAAVYNCVAQDAQHWLKRAEQVHPLKPEDSHFVRAAVAYSLHDDVQALDLLELAEAKSSQIAEAGNRAITQDCIADIRGRIAQRKADAVRLVSSP